MSSTSDALNALREAISGKRDIGYSNDSGPCSDLNAATTIVLSPSLSFPKDTPTRVRKPNNPTAKDPKTEPSLFYRLDAVLLAWLLRDASASEYMMRAREARILGSNVSTMDRRDLADWLMGKKSTHKDIIALACKYLPFLLLRNVFPLMLESFSGINHSPRYTSRPERDSSWVRGTRSRN